MIELIDVLALGFLIVFAALAVYFDLKHGIIPNKLNYGFLAAAVCLAFLKQLQNAESFAVFAFFAAFVAASFLFALLLYAVGAWAGGDTKFFTTTMAFFALLKPPHDALDFTAILWVFLLSALLLAPVAVIAKWKKIAGFRKPFLKAFAKSLGFAVLASLGIQFLLAAFAGHAFSAQNFFATLGVLAFIVFCFSALPFVRKALTRRIAVKSLESGMIPAETLYLKGSKLEKWVPSAKNLLVGAGTPKNVVVNSMRARGIGEKEIRVLKKRGVKYLLVREAQPFAPQLVAAVFAVLLILSWIG